MSRILILEPGEPPWLSRSTAVAATMSSNGRTSLNLPPIASARENTQFLPGFFLPSPIEITADDDAISQAEILVAVMPSAFVRDNIARLRPYFRSDQIVVFAARGVENCSYLRMSQVIAHVLAEAGLTLPIGALGGPSFAQEVAQGKSLRSLTTATPLV
jgi:glycerol-3-phosphate dehydrogenase (NAD(P)+)